MKFMSVVLFASSMAPVMPGRQGMIRKREVFERKLMHFLKKTWSNDVKINEIWRNNYVSSLSFPDKTFALPSYHTSLLLFHNIFFQKLDNKYTLQCTLHFYYFCISCWYATHNLLTVLVNIMPS